MGVKRRMPDQLAYLGLRALRRKSKAMCPLYDLGARALWQRILTVHCLREAPAPHRELIYKEAWAVVFQSRPSNFTAEGRLACALELEEVLMREDRAVGGQPQAGAARVSQKLRPRDAALHRRALLRRLVPVHVHHTRAARQARDQAAEEGHTVVHVVIDVDDDRNVAAAGRDHGVVISTQYGRHVVDAVQPLAYDLEHRRFRIDRVDMAGGADRAREEGREVAGAAAPLSDHLSALEAERAHERRRLLPLRALRIELPVDAPPPLLGRHFFGAPQLPVGC